MNATRRPRPWARPWIKAAVAVAALWCAAPGGCGGGGGSSTNPLATNPAPGGDIHLTEADVNKIVLQAIHEANAEGNPATIAVVDRVGNVLTVAQMTGAPANATITSNRGVTTGLENVSVPSTVAAISKAITGAYLSSNGNAFSTRTANQIVQEHFDPGQTNFPAGPLFGVQFSQLICSDFNTAPTATPGTGNAGPHFSPLGFAADSGGMPLYKNGVLAGGIGVMTKNTYSLDLNIFDIDVDADELVAIAGTTGFDAPAPIRADNFAVNGQTLRYTDVTAANLKVPVAAVGAFAPVAVPPFFTPVPGHNSMAGLTYGSTDGRSGIVPDGTFGPVLYPGTTDAGLGLRQRHPHRLVPADRRARPDRRQRDHRGRSAAVDDERAQRRDIGARRDPRADQQLRAGHRHGRRSRWQRRGAGAHAGRPGLRRRRVAPEGADGGILLAHRRGGEDHQHRRAVAQHGHRHLLADYINRSQSAGLGPASSPTAAPGRKWRSATSRGRSTRTASTPTAPAR